MLCTVVAETLRKMSTKMHYMWIFRTCVNCPVWEPSTLAPEVLARQLVVPQWGNALDLRRGTPRHCLHGKVLTVAEAIKELDTQLKNIPTHVYKMYWQWESLERAKADLKLFHLLTEEDYQQNVVITPCATTTSSHMSANERSVAMYPVVGYTRLTEGGPIVKLGWILVSDDTGHDYHQVEVNECKILDSFEKRFGWRPLGWTR
jgi:hypothetical protein